MEELLASLTKKAKLECEEEHRQVVASLNGLAGLHIIREQVRSNKSWRSDRSFTATGRSMATGRSIATGRGVTQWVSWVIHHQRTGA